MKEEENKLKALQLLKLRRFPQGVPGTIIVRCGKKYLVNEKGEQRRIKDNV